MHDYCFTLLPEKNTVQGLPKVEFFCFFFLSKNKNRLNVPYFCTALDLDSIRF